SSRRFFYWSQEPKEDKDDEWVTKINDYINNPPAPGSRAGTGGSGSGGLSPASALADLSSLPEADLQGLLNNMSPQQFMSVLGGVGGMGSAASLASLLGAATGARNTTPSAATSQVSTPAAPQTPATTPAVVSAATMDLSSSLTLDALQPLLTNEEFMRRVREALPAGPDTADPTNTSAVFASTVQSPQFQQALSTFSSALQSGQLGPLINQFSLGQDCVDAANAGDMESFVKALQKHQSKEGSAGGDKAGAADTTTKDDDMALD
ncbi:unnamed protein product, partial [Medioppia subpectinata]